MQLAILWTMFAGLLIGSACFFFRAAQIRHQIDKAPPKDRQGARSKERRFESWLKRFEELRHLHERNVENEADLATQFRALDRDAAQRVFQQWQKHDSKDSVPVKTVRQLRMLINEPGVYLHPNLVEVRKRRGRPASVQFKFWRFLEQIERGQLRDTGYGPLGRFYYFDELKRDQHVTSDTASADANI